MPASPEHSPYDLTLIDSLLEEGCMVLTPNHRLARCIRSAWDQRQRQRGGTAWPRIPVQALEHCLADSWQQACRAGLLPHRRLLGSVAMQHLWTAEIERDARETGNYSLLHGGMAATQAQQARELLLSYRIDPADPALARELRLGDDSSAFLRWLQGLQQRLAELGAGSASDRLADLASVELPRQQRTAVLLDFDDVTPLSQHLLEQRFTALRPLSSGGDPAAARAEDFPDRESELQAAARWACTSPDKRLGIVLTDMPRDRSAMEYFLRHEFDCMGDNYNSLPVNFSTGIALDQAPLVRDGLAALGIAGRSIPLSSVVALLRSRFLPAPGAGRVALLQALYRDGAMAVNGSRLRQLAGRERDGEVMPLAGRLQSVVALRLAGRRLPPSGWAEQFSLLLEQLGWPGDRSLDSLEYQQLQRWYDVLEEYAGLDVVTGELELESALSLLRRCCQQAVSQPRTDDSSIQVLGPLEAAGLKFDALWVCGMQGSRWPAPARPNPLLPLPLQRRHNMPHSSSEREWQYAESLLSLYRGSCSELVLSHARQLEGVPELPSPLLAGLPQLSHDAPASMPALWQDALASGQLETVPEPPLPLGAADIAGLTGGSGIIEQQAACPFRAAAHHRLAARPLEPARSGLTAAERGSLLHQSLHHLWQELGDSAHLAALSEEGRAAAVERATGAAVAAVPGALAELVGFDCLALEQQRLQQLLLEWLAVEMERTPFRVVAAEQELKANLAGLPLTLRVDRVDELANGQQVVIDYKSGKSSVASWMGERPRQPQLPLYAITTGVDAASYAQVLARDCRYSGLGDCDGLPGVSSDIARATRRYGGELETWEQLAADWRRSLEALATGFLAGEAAVDPMPQACTYCGLQALCRVGVTAAGDDESTEEDE